MPPTVEHRRGCHGGAMQRGRSQQLKNDLFKFLDKNLKKIGNDVRTMFMVKVYYSRKSSNEIDFLPA